MNYQEDDSAICLYVDELKSDDQSLKLNAVDKIEAICRTLSDERIKNEFFPYLRYIIEECDNEDEFLVKMAENLILYLENRCNLTANEENNQNVTISILTNSKILNLRK